MNYCKYFSYEDYVGYDPVFVELVSKNYTYRAYNTIEVHSWDIITPFKEIIAKLNSLTNLVIGKKYHFGKLTDIKLNYPNMIGQLQEIRFHDLDIYIVFESKYEKDPLIYDEYQLNSSSSSEFLITVSSDWIHAPYFRIPNYTTGISASFTVPSIPKTLVEDYGIIKAGTLFTGDIPTDQVTSGCYNSDYWPQFIRWSPWIKVRGKSPILEYTIYKSIGVKLITGKDLLPAPMTPLNIPNIGQANVMFNYASKLFQPEIFSKLNTDGSTLIHIVPKSLFNDPLAPWIQVFPYGRK